MNVDPPQFTNACDYHIPAPTGLSTLEQSLQARHIASCKACNTECALQSFDRASRAECLMSCDPSPMTPGQTEQPGSVNYPDPILDLAEDVRNNYLPEMTALTCPEGVDTNGGKFAGSIQCRPFTETLQKEALAAAAASAQNACDAVRNQMNFRCDMADCASLSDEDCTAARLCTFTAATGDKPSSCAWNTQLTTNAINACMGNSNECKTGNSVFDSFSGLACDVYGKARADATYNGKDYKRGDMRPFAGQYTVENGQFMCKKLGDGETARTAAPRHPSGSWPAPQTEAAAARPAPARPAPARPAPARPAPARPAPARPAPARPAPVQTTPPPQAQQQAQTTPPPEAQQQAQQQAPPTPPPQAQQQAQQAAAVREAAAARAALPTGPGRDGQTRGSTQLNRPAVNLQCEDAALGC